MTRKVSFLTLCLLMLPALAYAACPRYQVGFQGFAEAYILGILVPIVGAQIDLTTPEGQSVQKVTDAAGKYVVKLKTNNCHKNIGLYTQSWSVKINANPAGFPQVKTCSATIDFFCCSEQYYNQSFIRRCNLLYKLGGYGSGDK